MQQVASSYKSINMISSNWNIAEVKYKYLSKM